MKDSNTVIPTTYWFNIFTLNDRNENKSAKRVDKSVEEVEHLVMKDGMLVEFVVPVLKDNNTTHPTPPQHDHNLSHRKNKVCFV